MLLQCKQVTHYFGGLCAVSDFNLDRNYKKYLDAYERALR